MVLPIRVARNNNVDSLDLAQREFDGFLNRFLGGQVVAGGRLAPYGVDVREDADHFYVEADLPGFKKDDVEITLEKQTLTISAQKSEQQNQEKPGELLLHERRYSRFQRSFNLPPTVDERTVNAKLGDGVLLITLNKREETKPRKIQVV